MSAEEMLIEVQDFKESFVMSGFKKPAGLNKFFDDNWMQILDILDDALYEYLDKDIITTWNREKEIIDAIFKMGLGRLNTETYPQNEVDKVIYKALKLMKGKERFYLYDIDKR